MPVYVAGSGAHWDGRRNTSQRREVEPGALQRCLDSLAALRRNDPALVQWVEDGHPNLTAAEHRARFGCDYKARTKR
jgi:hypothetical protein